LRKKWSRHNLGDTPSKSFQSAGEKVHSDRFSGLPGSSIGLEGTGRLPLIPARKEIIPHPATPSAQGRSGCQFDEAGSGLPDVSATPETFSLKKTVELEKTLFGITTHHQRNIAVWYKPYRLIPFIVLIHAMHSVIVNEVSRNGE